MVFNVDDIFIVLEWEFIVSYFDFWSCFFVDYFFGEIFWKLKMNVNFLRSVFFVNFNFECCFFFKLFGIIVDEVSGVFWEFNFKFEVVYVWVNFYCE